MLRAAGTWDSAGLTTPPEPASAECTDAALEPPARPATAPLPPASAGRDNADSDQSLSSISLEHVSAGDSRQQREGVDAGQSPARRRDWLGGEANAAVAKARSPAELGASQGEGLLVEIPRAWPGDMVHLTVPQPEGSRRSSKSSVPSAPAPMSPRSAVSMGSNPLAWAMGSNPLAWASSLPERVISQFSLFSNQRVEPIQEMTSKPQVLDGQNYGPVWWGITIGQVRELLTECQAHPGWNKDNNLYDWVYQYVIPRCDKGVGYALHANSANPLETSVMVSHCWAENAEMFVETLERSVGRQEAMFICAFAIYQNADGRGPSIEDQLGTEGEDSPFYQVLKHISVKGNRQCFRHCRSAAPVMCFLAGAAMASIPSFFARCVPSLNYCARVDASTGVWVWTETEPVYRVFVFIGATLLGLALLGQVYIYMVPTYTGRMTVVPNTNQDIYERLWCVYEIFTAGKLNVPVVLGSTLAHAGHCRSRDARCSVESDRVRICTEIETFGEHVYHDKAHGYKRVDRAIVSTMRSAWTPVLRVAIFQCLVLVFVTCLWPVGSMKWIDKGIPLCLGHVVGNMLGTGITVGISYSTAWREAGMCSTKGLLLTLLAESLLGCAFFALGFGGLGGWQCDWEDIPAWQVNLTAITYNSGLMLLINAPVVNGILWCKRVLQRAGCVQWDRVVAPAITLIYIGLATQATYVQFDVDSLYPSFLVLATACGASMYHIYFIRMTERWGVSWRPSAMREFSEGRRLFLSLSAAILVCLASVGVLCQRAMRCKEA